MVEIFGSQNIFPLHSHQYHSLSRKAVTDTSLMFPTTLDAQSIVQYPSHLRRRTDTDWVRIWGIRIHQGRGLSVPMLALLRSNQQHYNSPLSG